MDVSDGSVLCIADDGSVKVICGNISEGTRSDRPQKE